MAAMNLSPKNPLIVLGLVGVAAWLFTRRAAAASSLAPGKVNVKTTGQSYADPVYIAGQIGGAITALTKGFLPQGTEASRLANATIVQNADNRALVRSTEGDYYGSSPADDGVRDAYNRAQLRASEPDYYGAGSWSMPVLSAVNPASSTRSIATDAVAAGPIYDPTVDLVQNPWQWAAP